MSHDDTAPSESRRAVLRGAGAVGAAALAGSVPGSAAAADEATESPLPDDDELESVVDQVLADQLEADDIVGATVSIVADGDVRLAKGYGDADRETGRPVTASETPFRIGSVSKPVTATAVLQAVDRGELDLHADVTEYVDDGLVAETYEEPITLHHLLTHSAGFEERIRGTFLPDEDDPRSLEEIVTEERPERVRPPGEVASYSNYGSALAGYVLAQATDTPFAELVDERLFEPLGMDRSTFAQPAPGGIADELATGYEIDLQTGEMTAGGFEHVGVAPAGAMSATATDVARFMLAHLGDGALGGERVLDAETIREMRGTRFANHPETEGVGYGFIEQRRGDLRMVIHDGSTDQFHSLLVLLPEYDVGLFVSYNSPGGTRVRGELRDELLAEYFADATAVDPIEPDRTPTRADELAGTYRSTRMAESTYEKLMTGTTMLDVEIADDGALVTSMVGSDAKRRWVEIEPLVFREAEGDDTLTFRSESGEITHAFLGSIPVLGFERLATHERPFVQLGLMGVSLLVFLSGLVAWPAAWGWSQYRGRSPDGKPWERRPTIARVTAVLSGGAVFAFAVGLFVFLLVDPVGLLYGHPPSLWLLFAIPTVGAIAALGTLTFVVQSWHERYWSLPWRLHYALVAVAVVTVYWLLHYWNLLGFRF